MHDHSAENLRRLAIKAAAKLSPEDDARLTVATERLRKLLPRATAIDFELLADAAEKVQTMKKQTDDLARLAPQQLKTFRAEDLEACTDTAAQPLPATSATETRSDASPFAGHTPGPWFADLSGVESKHSRVCDVLHPSLAERNANARLIAAAPSLLAECDDLRACVKDAQKSIRDLLHHGRNRMKGYTVEIVDTQTGERRRSFQNVDWGDDEGSLFWWTEGNMSCDCNRGDAFKREREEPDKESTCNVGPNRYRVTHAELSDGRRVVIDGEAR